MASLGNASTIQTIRQSGKTVVLLANALSESEQCGLDTTVADASGILRMDDMPMSCIRDSSRVVFMGGRYPQGIETHIVPEMAAFLIFCRHKVRVLQKAQRRTRMNLDQIVPLLGKSERDEQVMAVLSELGVKQPISRPKGGWSDVNIIPRNSPLDIEFVFEPIENLETYTADFLEGELFFPPLIFRPSKDDVASDVLLPYGVSLRESLEWHLKKLGVLENSYPDWNRYRWKFGMHRVLLEFENDENVVIHRVVYSFDDAC
jgi:hypothetical protein